MPEIEKGYFRKLLSGINTKDLQKEYSEFIHFYPEIIDLINILSNGGASEFSSRLLTAENRTLKSHNLIREILIKNLNTLCACLAIFFEDVLDTTEKTTISKIKGDEKCP